MSVEERLSTDLRAGLDSLEATHGDPHAAMAAGSALRRRRVSTWTAAGVCGVVAAVAVGLGIAGRGDDGPAPTPAPAGGWTELPTPPLSPRVGAKGAWLDGKVVFVGGQVDNFCPPNADCADVAVYASDGAAFDPGTSSWTPIADAPVPVTTYTPNVVVDDAFLVIVGDDGSWWAYDAAKDSWSGLPSPSMEMALGDGLLSAGDGEVVALSRNTVKVLDLAEQTWRTLPRSPIRPRLSLQSAVPTDHGIVTVGVDSTAVNDGTVPSYVLAEVYRDGEWQRFERSDMVSGYWWHWTGQRLVSPNPFCVDGGEVNPYPRCLPQGGILDPTDGSWSELPKAPENISDTWSLGAMGGSQMFVGEYLYDDAAGTWTRIGSPQGAEDFSEPGSVVAAGGVVALGGIDWSRELESDDIATNRAWIWTP